MMGNVNKLISYFVLGSFLTVLPQCKQDDPRVTKLQYMPDMADGPIVKAQREYLDPPVGSVAKNAVLYPKTPEEAETQLNNPFNSPGKIEAHKEKGKALFNIYCAVCHGQDAKGEGHLVDVFPRPPDLTAEVYKNRKDGFFFHRITFGSAIMQGYGHSISVSERWDIILHLRTLQ